MSRHIEFNLAVPVWTLEEIENQPCEELIAICRSLDSSSFTQSPVELFRANEPTLVVSRDEPICGMLIDMTNDPTDQMDLVVIRVRCNANVADDIEEQLRGIAARSEVTPALFRCPSLSSSGG